MNRSSTQSRHANNPYRVGERGRISAPKQLLDMCYCILPLILREHCANNRTKSAIAAPLSSDDNACVNSSYFYTPLNNRYVIHFHYSESPPHSIFSLCLTYMLHQMFTAPLGTKKGNGMCWYNKVECHLLHSE